MRARGSWGRRAASVLAALAIVAGSVAGASGAMAAPPDKGGGGGGGTSLPNSVAALGDSLTQASTTCLLQYYCSSNSWATGSSSTVQSHVTRLNALGAKVRSVGTYAVPGAVAADVPAQASRAVSQGAKYVTLLVGANDACASSVATMTTVATFRSHIDTTLTRLAASGAKPTIFVASIPNLQRLWEVNKDYPNSLASITDKCRALAEDTLATQARVDAFNAELAAACAATAKCWWDGGAVANTDFLRTDLSWDWFHPNLQGQKKLAAITWDAGPWTP